MANKPSKKKIAAAQKPLPKLTQRELTILNNKNGGKATEYQIKNRRAQKAGFKSNREYLKIRAENDFQNKQKVEAGKSKGVNTKNITSKNQQEKIVKIKVNRRIVNKNIKDKIKKATEDDYNNFRYATVTLSVDYEDIDTGLSYYDQYHSESLTSIDNLNELIDNPVEYLNNRPKRSARMYTRAQIEEINIHVSKNTEERQLKSIKQLKDV